MEFNEIILKGVIGKVYDLKDFKSFKKKEFILNVESQENGQKFPILLVAENNETENFNLTEGVFVTIKVKVSGRLWTSKEGEVKCFNTLSATFL